ncbi:MAG: ABC transporter ATP-binding protein/permease [Oscillospiraceae bacterium]|nr:ABC transporter ATP-binding protein/permease [Oscillospiraceae bacterium]
MRTVDYSKSKLAVFAAYIRPHRGAFALDMALSLAVALVDLAFPYVTRGSMNRLLPEKLYTAFFLVMASLFAAYLLRAWFQYLITIVGHRMGTLVEADMRRDVFVHMQSLSFSFFDKNRTGVLLARVTNDLFEIVELAHHGPENLLTCSVTLLGALIILFTVNWQLALVLLVLLPACIAFSLRQRLNMQRANREVKVRTGEINAAIESGISGIRTSKAFAAEKAEDEKFDRANDAFKQSKVRYYRAMGRFNAGVEATVGIMQVAVVSFGGLLIMKGRMDLVDLLTFTLYVATFISPIRKLAQFMEVYAQGSAGFSRFLELMRTRPEITDAPDAEELRDVRGEIRFDHVDFSYQESSPVLQDVSFTVAPGETFALVGSSGGGKTTICHLIPRFYDVSGGSVSIDGRDVRSLTQESLRRHIGIIQQDVFLFAGTVMDNIRYGRPGATDREVIEAAVRAEIHDDIMNMPDGYQSFVGERGIVLSGGQKQRISIARVFLKNPPILILDEATSALDSVTEQKIQKSLDLLSRGKTCIVIAHRLSTIRNATRIAVVDGRQLAEQGTRAELLALNGEYAALEHAQNT